MTPPINIFYIDPNNDTAQVNYPLIHSLQQYDKLNIILISSYNRFNSPYYDKHYPVNVNYLFFKLANKIASKSLRQIVKIYSYFFDTLKLIILVLKKKPDIIHYNWLSIPLIDFVAICIFKLMGKKVVLTRHNYVKHGSNKLKLSEQSIFNLADHIICLSEFVKSQFSKKNQKKISLIEHGNVYEKEIKHYSKLYTKPKNTDQFKFLFIGNIRPYKGVDLLIEAMNILINERSKHHIRLKIAGNCNKECKNSLLKKIRELSLTDYIETEIKFLEYSDMFKNVIHSDAGILPYREASQSGLPYIFIALYRPLVITKTGGLPEQTDLSFSEITTPSAGSLAEGMLKLCKRVSENKIPPSSYKPFLKKSKWENTIQKYVHTYDKISEGNG